MRGGSVLNGRPRISLRFIRATTRGPSPASRRNSANSIEGRLAPRYRCGMDGNAAAVAVPEAPGSGHGRFVGEGHAYRRLLRRDAMALIATLGLYRFWVSTDVRQYLWSRSEIAGEQLDYTGNPIELLVGFLVLVAFLGPLLAVLSIVSIAPDLSISALAAYLPIAVLWTLGVLALYQARRYRVNHTVFRGIRFHQTGSAWVYAILTTLWFAINLMTLGLSYPWARASLERYKMRHTFYGDVQGSFAGRGGALFRRGILLLVLILVPILFLLFRLGNQIQQNPGEQTAAVSEFYGYVAIWFAVIGLVIYPTFHARVLRWRVAGIRFGTLSVQAEFSTWQLYKAYLKFSTLVIAIAILALIVAAIVQLKIVPALPLGTSIGIEFVGVVALVVSYFIVATLVAISYQATVRLTTWRLIVDAMVLSGIDQLDRVKLNPAHAARHSGRIGAALNVGGF